MARQLVNQGTAIAQLIGEQDADYWLALKANQGQHVALLFTDLAASQYRTYGLGHLYQGISGALRTFVLGLILSLVYLANDSLLPRIIIPHAD